MSRGRRKSEGDPPNPLGWMVTFSDLVTLLLTFFVLLISMSSMDVKAMEQAFGTFFSGGSGVLEFSSRGKIESIGRIIEALDNMPTKMNMNPQELKNMIFDFNNVEFQSMMELVDRDIEVFTDERGLVIRLADYIFFDEGATYIRAEYLPILTSIANILRSTYHPISVEGHTDDSSLEGGDDAWAWELSLERAIAIVEYFTLEEGLPEERFRVAGYGPSKPLAPNINSLNRLKNRRIEIVLYKENFS